MFDFVQKHFVSEANVSQFAQPKKHAQQCVLVYQGLNDTNKVTNIAVLIFSRVS